jgi:AcrR family transcriptional regulator
MQAQTENLLLSPRLQLIEGLCVAVEARGLAATRIADIVRHARVSKRTFYEHFADKEACFVEAYREMGRQTMDEIAAAVDLSAPWQRQIEAALLAYFTALDARPKLTRAFFLEIHVAGARALSLRREVLERFAELTGRFVALARKQHPELRPLTPLMATAIVGGINELMLLKAEKAMRMNELLETAVTLVTTMVAPAARGKR